MAGPQLSLTGVKDGAVLNAAALKNLTVSVGSGSEAKQLKAMLNGRQIDLTRSGSGFTLKLGELAEGAHELVVTAPGRLPLTGGTLSQRFRVDATPPRLQVPRTAEARKLNGPFTFTGRAPDAARLTVDGRRVPLRKGGAFSISYQRPPDAVRLVATDEAGNRTEQSVGVVVKHPPMRAVHVTGMAWASPPLRDAVLKMAREGRINAIQLDIKDESGEVSYDSRVPLARQIKATRTYYDARKTIDLLHGMNLQVVGRIVAFRDPILGKASWKAGKRDRLVRDAKGGAYDGGHYGNLSFTNLGDREVRQYNIDLAEEAARLGFDDILYDYVRRPDGKLSSMRFPGLKGTPEDGIATFLADTRRVVRPHGAFLGASVYGIAATRPLEIAQDMKKIGPYVDYVAPMVYPSHWGAGEFGLSNPNNAPFKVVNMSIRDFHKSLRGTNAQVIPWLQDFSLGKTYGVREVRAQIDGAKQAGSPSFLLWSPSVTYHAAALDRQ
ncbi:hypothetical protein D5H75_36405 [Bailinhaonella thermotolerans]|uniref:DUF4015 domain-containing protein n=2 Tax=Bailinhaonella thermotolerans TaxID=1070861 RepID=A0A3A4A8B1_9ACTN|nr:hypothetical protein D5H75_36405 [Bailinhaonella thermotolerans]